MAEENPKPIANPIEEVGKKSTEPEAKTMKKDLARLRLSEAEQEREKIVDLQKGDFNKEQSFKKVAQEKTEQEQELEKTMQGVKIMQEKEITPEQRLEMAKKRVEAMKQETEAPTPEPLQPRQEPEQPLPLKPEIPQPKQQLPPKPQSPSPDFDRPVKIVDSFPEKPTTKQKKLPRVIITFVFGFIISAIIISFSYWFFVVREKPKLDQSPVTEQPQEITEPQEAIPPFPLISIETEKIIEVQDSEKFSQELLNKTSETVSEQTNTELVRLLTKDTVKNKFLNLEDVFNGFDVSVPQELLEKIELDSTFFIHHFGKYNRLGFITRIKSDQKQNVEQIMTNWTNMEVDMNRFLVSIGRTEIDKEEIVPAVFKKAKYKEIVFNYTSFADHEKFGICWFVTDDYLVFTTSGESVLKIIDILQNNE